MRAVLMILTALALLATSPAHAESDGYEEDQAGHPLRIAAYALHPVGVLLDRVIFRPAWHLGQKEPAATWVGADVTEEKRPAGTGSNPFLEPYSEE